MPPSAPPSAAARRLQREARASAALALVAVGAAAFAAGTAAGAGPAPIALAPVLFAAAAAALFRYLPLHLPQPRLGAANRVTLLRLALVALLAATLAMPFAAWAAVALASVAAALDGVDGWLARRHGTASRFGARFDMETDQLLIVVLALAAWHLDKAGAWVLAAALPRYAFVAAARAWPWLAQPLPASRRRKAACAAQIVALIAAIAPAVPPPWSGAAAAAGLAALVASFAIDIAWLRRHSQTTPQETPP